MGLDDHISSTGLHPYGRILPLRDLMIYVSSPMDLLFHLGLWPPQLNICELKALWFGLHAPDRKKAKVLVFLYAARVGPFLHRVFLPTIYRLTQHSQHEPECLRYGPQESLQRHHCLQRLGHQDAQ